MLLIQLVIPVIEILAFWILLRPPLGFRRKGLKFQPVHYGTSAPIPVVVLSKESITGRNDSDEENMVVPSFFALPKIEPDKPETRRQSMKEHIMDELHYIPAIGKYITPLFANYFFNYFTNQGLVRAFIPFVKHPVTEISFSFSVRTHLLSRPNPGSSSSISILSSHIHSWYVHIQISESLGSIQTSLDHVSDNDLYDKLYG